MPAPPALQANPNLAPNPTFANAPLASTWEPTNLNTVTQSTTQIFAAPFSAAVTITAINEGMQEVNFHAVKPNVTYTTWAWVWQASSGTIGVGFNEFDQNQVYQNTQGTDIITIGGQWQRLEILLPDPMLDVTRFVKMFVSRRTAVQDYFVGMVYQALPVAGADAARPLQGKGAAR